ncbi:MAG: transposase, partial [Methylococcaceae bacterium]|nr:transposase [Methylococcaceae bacterium]
RHYAVFLANEEQVAACDRKTFTEQHDKHWHIEQCHRAIKQVCNIEHFQARSKVAIKNHLFAAICG